MYEDKVKRVMEFLKTKFPAGKVTTKYEHDRIAQLFIVRTAKADQIFLIPCNILEDCPLNELEDMLEKNPEIKLLQADS